MLTRVVTTTSILCLLFSAAGFAQGFSQGDKTLSLSGSGASDNELSDNDFGFEGSRSYFMTDAWEIALRQGLAFNDVSGSDDEWNGAKRVAPDYNFDSGHG